jgi:glycosyltransferase involved in cell wall biosynthesis
MSGLQKSNAGVDILCFSLSDWYGNWGSRQQVMTRFAQRGYRVLFVERQAGMEHLIKYPDLLERRLARWHEGLVQLEDRLWIASPPVLSPGRYYSDVLNRFNQQILAQWVRPLMRRLAIEAPILWLYKPEQWSLIGRLGERLCVYHCIDEFRAGTSGRKRRIISAQEDRLLQKADIVFANSALTFEAKRAKNECTVRIPSGVDVAHFAKAAAAGAAVHKALREIPHPIAGYIGNINEKVDVSLLGRVAAILSEWQFVFVGQAFSQRADLEPLRSKPNVHWLGKHRFEDMPMLVAGMDVCMLPYVDSELGWYRSPLKLYEYLAAGKPVVSTEHPEARELEDVIEIASEAAEYAEALVRVVQDDSPSLAHKRVATAERHSWDRRVDDMERAIHRAMRWDLC